MPRPRIRLQTTDQRQETEAVSKLSMVAPSESKTKTKLEEHTFLKVLRKKRSKEYMEAFGKLDSGGHAHSREMFERLMEQVREELQEAADEMIGVVAKCRIGVPYDVHTIDFLTHGIICHYKRSEGLPDGMERVRALARLESYSHIEVYHNMYCCVGHDGSVAIVKG